MSLLMKALEKAAKDRTEARAEPATLPGGPAYAQPAPATMPPTATASAAKSELTLEPISLEPSPAPAPRSEPAPRQIPTATPRAAAPGAAREQQAQAATVLRAGGDSGSTGAIAWVRARPVAIVGILGVLIAIAYGAYVYLQLFHPAMFLPQRPIAPKVPPSPVGAAPAAPGVAAGGVATQGVPGVPGSPAVPGAPATPGAPLPTAAVVQAEAPDFSPPPPPPTARPVEKPVAEPAPPPPPAPRDMIKVSRGSAEPSVNPLLTNAYAALQSGRRDDAGRAYGDLLRAEPRNVDALLGLAAIAATEGRGEEAARRYAQVLEIDPRNALAQTGLIGLTGRADPLAAESRLRQLIASEPSAFLYFTLGNLYADQSLWAQAQHAYFQAHHLEPDNPDYAYNLAVGLEHVSQARLALGFYRRAVELAGARGSARFDVGQARDRIGKLASRVE